MGLVLACIGMVVLLPKARTVGADHFWACLVFLVTGSLVFLTSSIYHFLHDGYEISARLEHFFENVDHFCIYLFIAGTYTPVLINAVDDTWREHLLLAIWSIAVLGILYTSFKHGLFPLLRSRAIYTGLFVLMGWLLVFRIGEIYARLSPLQLVLLLGGMLVYFLGAIGYVIRRPTLVMGIFGYHEVWHLMVLTGAMFHFCLIYSFY